MSYKTEIIFRDIVFTAHLEQVFLFHLILCLTSDIGYRILTDR